MRELKFRAWSIEKQSWVYFRIDNVPTWVHPAEVYQYIGLKDKNGREIYEGDIVTGWFNNQKIVGQVFYGSNAAFFIQRKDLLGISLINADSWLEVIGNVYENPELLNA
ncbi:MAG: hypothetical protein BAA01_09315 [Bacillus thermozeamaize]|uniref:YopX protein domain-containing protein n=1 Tax=Bacillus thermozeamaize TaxID=230954 RepID=A0A1Y3PEB5_9BACI|nr:MAG: hypothetical protein BAA01_09315 [Bacillus thermozeamaize]